MLIDAADRVLLRQRPLKGLLAGLWEFPSTEGNIADFARELTGAEPALTSALTVTHTFSHFRAHYHAHAGRLPGQAKAPQDAALRWVSISELETYALPVAMRKLADRVVLPG
jgi:A/G-specific adenine glycosylase